MRILGIDPGSRITGFGVIESHARGIRYIASGCVRLKGDHLSDRLRELFGGVEELLARYAPQEVAIERVFVRINVASALQLGQARGVALCAVAIRQIPLFEYSPAAVKKAVAGQGRAAKEQIQRMVQQRLQLAGVPQVDAADALAIALCHAQSRALLFASGVA